jgi:GNAT superfamily N-acetyltransferase
MGFSLRLATPADHAVVARLFPELAVPDPPPSPEHFVARMLPRVLVLEDSGEALGYAYWQRYGDVAHVTHVVVHPGARGKGAGRALLDAVRASAAAEGCARWYLNVKQDNASAIRLYERSGMAVEQEGFAVDVAWASLASLPGDGTAVSSFVASPDDDAVVAARLGLDAARLALLRARPGVVLLGLREGGAPVAFAAFDPAFPGAHQLRAVRVSLLRPLFDALREHARHERVHIFVDGERALYDALRAVGATLVHATYRMGAPLA